MGMKSGVGGHHLHQALFQGLAHQDFQNRLHFKVKVEKIAIFNLRLHVHADLHGNEKRRGRPIHKRVRLRHNLRFWNRVRELLQKRLGLDIHVPPAFHRLGGTRGAATRRPRQRARRQSALRGRRRVRVPSNHPAVEHDVAWVVGVLNLGGRLGTELGLWGEREVTRKEKVSEEPRGCLETV